MLSETDLVVDSLPVKGSPSSPGQDSFDEKASYNDEKLEVVRDTDSTSFIGDVYEDVRPIDMGDDGKERPIGMFGTSFALTVGLHC